MGGRFRAVMALLAAGVLLFLVGCGRGEEQPSTMENGGLAEEPSAPAAETYDKAGAPSRSMEAAVEKEARPAGELEEGSPGSPAGVPPGGEPAESARRRVYQGYGRLLVGSVDETRDRLFTLAEERGGYVESVVENTVVIRVPAEVFQEAFDLALALGEVLDSSVETFDVTDQFTDLAARLDIARRTRERLYALLERTGDVEERLRVLREIRRLTEQIERISRSLELLESQVAFSRITVDLVPRLEAGRELRREIPFRWIANLDPLYASLPRLKGRALFEPGPDFAVFEKEDSYRAESADGVRVRIGSTRNDPRGDGFFWRQALSFHLEPYYKQVEPFQAGAVQGVLLTSKDADPFFYLVGVAADGKTLHVVELFFPDRRTLDRRLESLTASLEELEIRGWLLP